MQWESRLLERNKDWYSVGLGKNCFHDDGFFGTLEVVVLRNVGGGFFGTLWVLFLEHNKDCYSVGLEQNCFHDDGVWNVGGGGSLERHTREL